MKEFTIQCKICTHEYSFTQNHCNDITNGTKIHYIGRMKKGSGKLISDTHILEISEGDVFYIPRGLKYKSYWTIGEEGVRFDSFGFSEFPSALSGKRFSLQKIDCNESQKILMDELATETKISYENSLKITGLLMLLLSQLFSNFAQIKKEDKQKILVDRALMVMKDNWMMDIPAVAATCLASESGLYAAFRKCGYDTPIHEKQKILIDKAVNLLISTDTPIEKISADLGFSSSSYFRKIFKRITQKTPREVRRDQFI